MKPRNLLTACMLVCGAASPALAQQAGSAADYPNRPVTFIVPYAPGGGTDLDSRMITGKLTENLRQQFIVDYKPGAGTTIGMTAAARSAPDGYTLFAVSATYPMSQMLYKDLPYDPLKAFTPLSLMTKRSTMLVVSPTLPVKNMKEYIAYARANPDKVNFASIGAGGMQHLTGVWMGLQTGTDITFIHDKGTGTFTTDLMTGRVQVSLVNFTAGLPLVKAGKVRIIGVTTTERSPLLPDVPTVAEQGVPGFEYQSWLGVVTVAGTPAPIVNKLGIELGKVARSPDVVEKLSAAGGLSIGNTPEEFRQYINLNAERWKKLVQDTGIKLEE